MSKFRTTLTGFMIAAVGAGGLVVLSAGPASAGATNDTHLVCNSDTTPAGDDIERCHVHDGDGIRTVLVRNTDTNQPQIGIGPLECGANTQDAVDFFVPSGNRYKVFITDCDGNKSTFVIRPNGDVNQVRP